MTQIVQTTLAVNPVDVLGALFAIGMVIWYVFNAARESTKKQQDRDVQQGKGYSPSPRNDEELTVEEIAQRRREEIRRKREAAAQPQPAAEDRRQKAKEAYERRMRELREAQARQSSQSSPESEQPATRQLQQPQQASRPIEARVNTPAQRPVAQRPAAATPPSARRGRTEVGSKSTAASTAGIGAATANRRTSNTGSPISNQEAAATRRSRSAARGRGQVPMPGEEMPDRESLRRLLMWREVLGPPMSIEPFDERQTL